MTPTKEVLDDIAVKEAASTATFGDAAFLEMELAKNPFTEDANLLLADINPSDFDGYAAIATTVAGANVGTNPATGGKLLEVKIPLGGFHWIVTGITNLPQSVYGYAVKANTSNKVLASKRFAAPVVLTAIGQVVDVPGGVIELPATYGS